MHADPRYGVLDAWNRMHDVSNVVVCDSSCFTTGPEKNPTPSVSNAIDETPPGTVEPSNSNRLNASPAFRAITNLPVWAAKLNVPELPELPEPPSPWRKCCSMSCTPLAIA